MERPGMSGLYNERMIKMGKLLLEEIALCVPTLSFEELKGIEAVVMQLA